MTIRGPFAGVVIVVLGLSLAANFLVLGFAAARVAGLRQGVGIERIIALGVRAFPPEIRREIVGKALGERSDLRVALADYGAARQKMFQAMRAEPFDAARLDAAFAEVRTKTETLQRVGQALVAVAIAGASPEARAKIRPPWSMLP